MMQATKEACWYCGETRTDGKPHELSLQHATTKAKKSVPIARCSGCEEAHRVGIGAFLLIWIFVGGGLAGYVFWLWFETINGNPRGYRVAILVTVVLASLPGLALGKLARNMVHRTKGARGPIEVGGHPQVEASAAEGWRVAR